MLKAGDASLLPDENSGHTFMPGYPLRKVSVILRDFLRPTRLLYCLPTGSKTLPSAARKDKTRMQALDELGFH